MGCANSVKAPTWDIQRRRDRLFTDLYGKRMVGKPSLFCEDLGRQIHDPFLLAISRRQFCEPRFLKEETEYREKRRSQVKCNLGKMCRVWSRTRNCFILCYQYWWTKDDHGPTVRDLSLFFQLFSETSINLDSWLSVMHIFSQCLFAPHPTKPLICCLSSHGCPLTSACQDRFFIRSKSALVTTRNGYSESTPTLTFVCCSYGYYLIKYLIKCSLIIFGVPELIAANEMTILRSVF